MKKVINFKNLKNNIYEQKLIIYNAKQVSIILRLDSLLFSDSTQVWEFDLETRSFYELDLQEKIQDIFNGMPINHSFKNAVMDFLPLLDKQKIQDYGKSLDFKGDDLEKNTPMKLKYLEFVKNEQYVNRKISYNLNFNEKNKLKYEVINFC